MLVWDNQQETSWFVGILEGEGSCSSMNRTYIKITNTNTDIISICCKYLNSRGFIHSVQDQTPKNPKWKKVYNICISGTNNCYTLIKTLGNSFQCRYQEFMNKLQLGSSTTTRDASPDIYWLVGIFEAEGFFSLDLNNENYYTPVIGFKNTNELIVNKFITTLKDLGLSWYVTTYQRDLHKKEFSIRIRGMKRCVAFLRKTSTMFQSTYYKIRAEKLYEFCQSRLKKNQQESYSESEHQIYRDLKI